MAQLAPLVVARRARISVSPPTPQRIGVPKQFVTQAISRAKATPGDILAIIKNTKLEPVPISTASKLSDYGVNATFAR